MYKSILFLFVSATFLSCESSPVENNGGTEAETKPSLITFGDHALFVSEFIAHQGLEGVTANDVKKSLNLSSVNEDSIVLGNCTLKRSFYFEGDYLEAIKYASYTDSMGMLNSFDDIAKLKSNLSDLLNFAELDSTFYTYNWVDAGISYQLKTFPKEGVDLIISKAVFDDETNCVGDLYAAQEYLNSLIQKKISDSISFDTTQAQVFNGITIGAGNNEILVSYACAISKKLLMLDAKSFEKQLNTIVGAKPSTKDGMLFWSYPGGEIQLDAMSQGFSIKFIQ